MKKVVYLIVVAAIVFTSCDQKKPEATAAETPKGTGYTLDSSANIELVKKINYAFPMRDSAFVFANYADTAKVHDNLTAMSIKENFRMVNSMLASGAVLKVEKIESIWETVNYKPAPNGVANYVDAYVMLSFKKGSKSVTLIMNQAFAIINGKIVEEWDTYDTEGLMSLMK